MDAVAKMGEIIKRTAYLTRDRGSIGCAKFVVFANVPEDNPFMAGAFHGAGEGEAVVSVGVSGPGVVANAIKRAGDCDFSTLADIVKKTAFKITRVGQLVALEASKAARRTVRNRRPVARADAGDRRLGRAHTREHGA